MGRKLALIIGNSQYEDAGLSRLAATQVDIRELADVLEAPDIGQFDDVTQLADQGLAAVRRAIARFFTDSKRDDLLVLYFSGHGVKDEQGHLYLAVKDTERHLLAGTGIETAFITAQMDRSYARRQVLILDCCHSGAFAYGAKSGAMDSVGTGPAFEGRGNGRVVLTATDAVQYAWQGDQVIGESATSVFTHYLLQGLRTGEADRDGDGFISLDELYDYVHENVVRETPKQTPGKWTYRQEGEIIVARNRIVRPADLPVELQALVDSPLPRLRAEAVPELAALLTGHHPGLVLAARTALERLRADDSRRVSAAAEAALVAIAQRAPVRDTTKRDDEAQREVEALLARNEFERAERAIDEAEKQTEAVERFAVLRDRLQRARAEALEAAETERKAIEARERQQQLLVAQKLALEQEIAERTRQEEATKRAEAERIAREREVAASLRQAREHMARSEFVDALAALDQVRRLDAEAAGLAELTHAAEAGRAAAEEAERVRRDVEAMLATAAGRMREGHLGGALKNVEYALQLIPDNRAAVKLKRELQASIDERRRTEEAQRQAREREQKVTALIAQSKTAATHQAAIEILEGALALDPEHQDARQALAERTAALEQETAERMRQQALAAARTGVADLLAEGELDQAERAVAQAEKESGEPAAFDDLRQQLRSALRDRQAENERIERLRRQEEAKKRAEVERIAREHEVAKSLRRAREHMARREFVDALAALDQVRRLDAEAAGLAELTHSAEAGRALAEEAERVRRDVEAMLAEAAAQTRGGDLVAALEHVEHALQLDPDNRAAVTLKGELQASIEERRRTEEVQRQTREREQKVAALIARSKTAATHQAAIEMLEEALALDPEHQRARQALAERTAAREHEAAERVRQQALAAARTRVADLVAGGELDQAERALAQAERECREPAAFDDLRQQLRSALRQRQAENQRIERLRRQEEAKKRAEAERIAREREVAALLRRAREHMARSEFGDALAALDQVRRLDAEAAGLAELTHSAEAGRAAAAEAEKRLHDSRRLLAAASWRFRLWDVLGALTLVEDALRLDPQNQQASALRAGIQHAIDRGVTDWRTAAASLITTSVQSARSSRMVQLGLVVLLTVGIAVLYRVASRNETVTLDPTTGPTPISEGARPEGAPIGPSPSGNVGLIPLPTPAPPATPVGRAAAGPVASSPTPATGRAASPTGARSRGQGSTITSRGFVTAGRTGSAPVVPSVAPIPIGPSAGRGSSEGSPRTTAVETVPSNPPGAASAVAPTPVANPAPAPAPPTTTRPPPVSPMLRDQQAIRGLLQAYEAAYERKNVAGVESIWPAMGRILRGQLPLLNTVDLTLAIGAIKVDGDTASVSLRQDWYYDWKRAGMAPSTSRGSMVLSLRRRGDSWIVVDDRGR